MWVVIDKIYFIIKGVEIWGNFQLEKIDPLGSSMKELNF